VTLNMRLTDRRPKADDLLGRERRSQEAKFRARDEDAHMDASLTTNAPRVSRPAASQPEDAISTPHTVTAGGAGTRPQRARRVVEAVVAVVRDGDDGRAVARRRRRKGRAFLPDDDGGRSARRPDGPPAPRAGASGAPSAVAGVDARFASAAGRGKVWTRVRTRSSRRRLPRLSRRRAHRRARRARGSGRRAMRSRMVAGCPWPWGS
jgi:hypothetical protein